MCWFVVVGQSLQLCCMMICLGFIEHRDLVSAMLMASLFGYYFDATTNHLARCKCKLMLGLDRTRSCAGFGLTLVCV
jgi:hypothetical protein